VRGPADPERTVLILNANHFADALHPDAIYRGAVDNDGDLLNDIAFSYVFSEPKDGKQTVDVYLAANEDAESAEAVGEKIFSAVRVAATSPPSLFPANHLGRVWIPTPRPTFSPPPSRCRPAPWAPTPTSGSGPLQRPP
jgi:hypothetical protein